jgi:hypothetical protein
MSDIGVISSSVSDPNSLNNTAINTVAVPEPASIVVMAPTLAGLAFAIACRHVM